MLLLGGGYSNQRVSGAGNGRSDLSPSGRLGAQKASEAVKIRKNRLLQDYPEILEQFSFIDRSGNDCQKRMV